MALKTKAAILTELNLIAASLNTAYADTVSGVAVEVKRPTSPLRRLNKLFNISAAGVVTTNTAYVDAIFNGAGTALVNNSAVGSGTIRKTIVT